MWDLNFEPAGEKGKGVLSGSDSGSSMVVVADEQQKVFDSSTRRSTNKKSSSKIFGFCVGSEVEEETDQSSNSKSSPVTRNFFPVGPGDPEVVAVGSEAPPDFPRAAHWVGIEFSKGGNNSFPGRSAGVETTRLKKSRRGPRSRSSQYRGVTFYRRTGRWESHIW